MSVHVSWRSGHEHTFMCALVMAIVGRISTANGQFSASRIRKVVHTVSLLDGVFEEPRGEMAEGVHGHDLLGITPLGEWSNRDSRLSVGEVRPVRNRQCGVMVVR
jgi:hypothetical protein